MNKVLEELVSWLWLNLGLLLKIFSIYLDLFCGCLLFGNKIIDKYF